MRGEVGIHGSDVFGAWVGWRGLAHGTLHREVRVRWTRHVLRIGQWR